MRNNDRVYRGNDGRYYCRRSDGTTGLLIGAGVGGLLGNTIAPRADLKRDVCDALAPAMRSGWAKPTS